MNVDEVRLMVSGFLNNTEQLALITEARRELKSMNFFLLNRQQKRIWRRSSKHLHESYRLICLDQYETLMGFYDVEIPSIRSELESYLSGCDETISKKFGVLVSTVSLRIILSIKPLALPQELVNSKNLAYLLYDWAYNHSLGNKVLILETGIEHLSKLGPSGVALAKVLATNSVEGVCCPTVSRLKELALAILLGNSLVELHGSICVMDTADLITFGSIDSYGPEMVFKAKSDSWPDY